MVMHDGPLDLEAARIHHMLLGNRKQIIFIFLDRRDEFHDFRMAPENSSSGSAFNTSPASSQPRRAVMTPYCMLGRRCLVWCESVEIVNFAPNPFAVRIMALLRSRRSGLPLISRYTLRRAACAATRSKSKGKGSRLRSMRPVG